MFKFVGTPILIDFASYALVSQELVKNGSWEGQVYEFAGSRGIRRCFGML